MEAAELGDLGYKALVVMGFYLVVMLGLGWLGRKRRKEESLRDFYLAGSSFGFFVLFLTLFATQYSGNTLLGFAGRSYNRGGVYIVSITFMILVITVVGFLIHLYSAEFMRDDDAFARFFAYMNLFVSLMLILVLADNLLLLYLGWEGVGMCSFLLIGFWYKKPANRKAAQKAFIVTRVGDTAMAVGLFLLISQLGTLDIQEIGVRATEQWAVGSKFAVAAAALFDASSAPNKRNRRVVFSVCRRMSMNSVSIWN